jgi:uncharacterized MAPEG superfamily protein
MSREIFWLTLTLGATALFVFPYVLNRLAVRGVGGVLANPQPDDKPLAPWAQRAQRAHANAIENLVVFAPAALTVHLLSLGNAGTAMACAIYFAARVLHYLAYTTGIVGVRTLAYLAGWAATAWLIMRALGGV